MLEGKKGNIMNDAKAIEKFNWMLIRVEQYNRMVRNNMFKTKEEELTYMRMSVDYNPAVEVSDMKFESGESITKAVDCRKKEVEQQYDIRKANRTIEELIDFAETFPDLWEILLEENRQTASKLWSLI